MAYPTLNQNAFWSTLYNQIISIQTFAKDLGTGYSELKEMCREDGGIYGDTKIYISVDTLTSKVWNGEETESANLLNFEKGPAPKTQTIVVDKYRIIALSLGKYTEAKAFMDEGQFASFHGVMLGMIGKTKDIHENGLINTFVGTKVSSAAKATLNVDLTTALTGLSGTDKNRVEAGVIAKSIADLLIDMRVPQRGYNEHAFVRSYSPEDLVIVWNAEYASRIRKQDFSVLPNDFSKGGLVAKFGEIELPGLYFGHIASASDAGASKVIDASGEYDPTKGTLRSLVEKDYTLGGTVYHVMPGDELQDNATVGASSMFAYNEVYVVEEDVICKVMSRDAVKYLSSFETRTEFFNPRGLSTTSFLVWGYAMPELIKDAAFVTLKEI